MSLNDFLSAVCVPSPWENPSGFLADDQNDFKDSKAFELVIEATKPSVILDIGSWKGHSANAMADICRKMGLSPTIICIDTWLGDVRHWTRDSFMQDLRRRDGQPTVYQRFMGNVLARGNQDMIVPLPQTIRGAVQILRAYDVTADLIYINGAHDHRGEWRDVISYFPLLTPRGLMFGDGFEHAPIARSVHAFAEKQGLTVLAHRGDLQTWLYSKDPVRMPGFSIAAGTEAPAQASSTAVVSEAAQESIRPRNTNKKWDRYQMPSDMQGKTYLDVGCGEGNTCAEALKRGASLAVGVDLCTSPGLRRNVEQYGFTFIQMDIFSEKFWELPNFDVVLCSRVLYHVENVLSLLFRLRKTTRETLYLATAVHNLAPEQPMLLFHPGEDFASNPSNWWTPNRKALLAMLETCGFDDLTIVHGERERMTRMTAMCVRARATGWVDHRKVLPRKESLMSLSLDGGGRR
jgi:SAM-dependent methyltransferase